MTTLRFAIDDARELASALEYVVAWITDLDQAGLPSLPLGPRGIAEVKHTLSELRERLWTAEVLP